MSTPNRNDPCPCGSGKKYKKCCLGGTANVQGLVALTTKPAGHDVNAVNVDAPSELLMQAVALHQAGMLDEAENAYHGLLLKNRNDHHALHYLGLIAFQQGRYAEAANLIEAAIKIKRLVPAFHCNLGNACKALGQLDRAIAAFREAIRLDPKFQAAYSNLGNALRDQGKLDEAVASHRKALSLQPDFAVAHNNLAGALRDQGKLDEAIASYQQALHLKPDYADAYSNLLYLHAFTRDISAEAECSLAAGWEKIALTENERTVAHGRIFSFHDLPHFLTRQDRKLRIGVVSAELGQHSVAEFLEPFLEQLDRSRFHLTLYPTALRAEPRAERIMELADEHRSLVGLADSKASELIRADRIDVLIDTTGHMSGCRLGIFAHRAAPVQCHYIGYHGTTGLAEMDWYIADEELLPPGYDAHLRERIWRLPRLRIAYRGDASLPNSKWAPSPDGTVWLGSFNNLTKVREEALALWGRVMNAVPQSRLLLKDRKAADVTVQQRIRTELHRHGISDERVEFVSWTPGWDAHMALYDRLDIALDTIPLNSETTAFDALWMGVPLIALEGKWVGGRQASTVLKALGRTEWVAQDEDQYVGIVAALAADVAGRQSLRISQRARMLASPLCDAPGLARSLESAFEAMFDQWLAGRDGRSAPANSV